MPKSSKRVKYRQRMNFLHVVIKNGNYYYSRCNYNSSRNNYNADADDDDDTRKQHVFTMSTSSTNANV